MNIQTCIHKLGLATLWRLPPEAAHNVAIWALQKGVVPRPKSPDTPELVSGKLQTKDLPGIGKLRHPICLAAGFDKNAETLGHLHTLGFAAAEVGTVTPRPQDGNSKPRLFRLREQRALINRMGFNNCGIQTFAQNLAKAKKSETIANIMKIGVNVGKNKLTPKDQAINDYIHCLDKTNGAADYYVVNISSPNTPGLRDLGTDSFLSELEERISPEQLQTTYIKIDPDRTKKSFSRLIEKIAESRFAGIILSNTSSTTYPQKGGLATFVCIKQEP